MPKWPSPPAFMTVNHRGDSLAELALPTQLPRYHSGGVRADWKGRGRCWERRRRRGTDKIKIHKTRGHLGDRRPRTPPLMRVLRLAEAARDVRYQPFYQETVPPS